MKGRLIIDGAPDMEKIVSVLTQNNYEVRGKMVQAVDACCMEYQIDYKRRDED